MRKLDAMWQKLSHTSIKVHWSYVPRIGNKVADHLAGIAADSLRYEAPLCEDVFFDSGGAPYANQHCAVSAYPAAPKQWHVQARQNLESGAEIISLESRHSGTLNCFCAFVSTIV